MYPLGGWNKCLIFWNLLKQWISSDVRGSIPAHSAGWLILFLACCTNSSGPSVHAANSSKPPPTPLALFRFSQLSFRYCVGNFCLSLKRYVEKKVSKLTLSRRQPKLALTADIFSPDSLNLLKNKSFCAWFVYHVVLLELEHMSDGRNKVLLSKNRIVIWWDSVFL